MSKVLGSFYADEAALHIAKRNIKPDELSLVFKKVDCPAISSFYWAVFLEEFQLQIPKTSSVPLQFNLAAIATKAG